MEDEIIQNLDLLINLDTLEQEDMWDQALDKDSELNQSSKESS
jgi:hypothetical protein